MKDIIVTKIHEIMTVPSPRGRYNEIKKRYCFGLSFCNNGKITYTHNGVHFMSDKNCAILLPKGQSYSLYGNESGNFPVINFDCEGLNIKTITVIPLKNSESYLKDFEKMKNLFLFNNQSLKAMSIFYDILSRLETESKTEKNILKTATEYIEKHISDTNLNNTVLADEMHISEVYFRRLFKKSFGVTPKQFILEIRIKKAKQMLGLNELKITEISELCGFSSVYHFCRTFKDKTGLTPSEYRKTASLYII